MVGIWHWQIPTFIITDISPPWWDFVMVGICRQAIIIIVIIIVFLHVSYHCLDDADDYIGKESKKSEIWIFLWFIAHAISQIFTVPENAWTFFLAVLHYMSSWDWVGMYFKMVGMDLNRCATSWLHLPTATIKIFWVPKRKKSHILPGFFWKTSLRDVKFQTYGRTYMCIICTAYSVWILCKEFTMRG